MQASKYLIISALMFGIVVALLIGAFVLAFGIVKSLSFSDIYSFLTGRDVAGVSYGLSTGNCETTESFEGIRAPAVKGKISLESHLVTEEDWQHLKHWPTSSKEGMDFHLNTTNFKENCPGCDSSRQVWTLPENGYRGQGSASCPPADLEPWIVSSRWTKNGKITNPPPGTKVIVFSPRTNRYVVGVAGYERGPSASTGHTFGAQPEVLSALDIGHGDTVIVGFAKDQSLTPGPISCSGQNTTLSSKHLSVPCIAQDRSMHCGRASTAMVIAFLTGKYFTTTELLRAAGLSSFSVVATLNKLTNTRWKKVEQNKILAMRSIDAGYPVIVYTGLYKSSRNRFGHIIVAKGYDTQGYFYFNNPRRGGCRLNYKRKWGDWPDYLNGQRVMVIPTKIR